MIDSITEFVSHNYIRKPFLTEVIRKKSITLPSMIPTSFPGDPGNEVAMIQSGLHS